MLRQYILHAACLSVFILACQSTAVVAQSGGDLSKIPATLLQHGLNPIGDIVPAGQSIANRQVYRQAFAELRRERAFYDYDSYSEAVPGQTRGQEQHKGHTVWFNPMGRAGDYASTLPVDPYSLESYGFQGGSTIVSTQHQSFGIVLGYERGLFRNRYDSNSAFKKIFSDWVDQPFRSEGNSTRFDDYYLGLYYGRVFSNDLELRAYVGGGHQRYKTSRHDQLYNYVSTYEGASFELNVELGTLVDLGCGTVFRPYLGIDIESVLQESAKEEEIGSLFRSYDRSTFGHLHFRLGADLERRWRRVDIHGGIAYTCMVFGDTRPETRVFYPGYDNVDFMMSGARLGRSSINFKTGATLYLNSARTTSLFVDYMADVFLDRDGDTGLHTGAVGFAFRF